MKPSQTGEVRFVVDAMLGKLARWLRLLGYDVLLDPQARDEDLLRLAAEQGRVLLTRDTQLLEQGKAVLPGGSYLRVVSDRWQEQLEQVATHFQLNLRDHRMTRCPLCNVLLEEVPKDQVQGQVPPFVYRSYASFFRCSTCQRIFWEGSHYDRINAILDRIAECVSMQRVCSEKNP